MNWAEIKSQVRDLCFEKDDAFFEQEYGAGLVAAANSCLQDLANTSARFHETLQISPLRLPSLLSAKRGQTFFYTGTPLEFCAAQGRRGLWSYTFACDGVGSMELIFVVDGQRQVVMTVPCDSKTYKVYSGTCGVLLQTIAEVIVRFTFQSACHVKDVALYDVRCDPIPTFGFYDRYDMRILTTQLQGKTFRSFDEKLPVTNDGQPISDFAFEGDHVILISTQYDGQLGIPYTRYPALLPQGCPDSFVPDIDLAAQELMPYFIAARVYLEYDAQKAAYYNNLYIARKQETFRDLPVNSTWGRYYGW